MECIRNRALRRGFGGWRSELVESRRAARNSALAVGQRLTTSSGNEGAIALSPDGKRLAFTSRGGVSRLWAFALDSTGERLVEPGTPITEDGADIEDSDISRDGRMAAFALSRQGREANELWTIEIDTRKQTLIAKNASGPRWSFDSTQLAYVRPDRLVVLKSDPASGRSGGHPTDCRLPCQPAGRQTEAGVVASWTGSSSIPFAVTLWPVTGAADKPARTLLADSRASLWQAQFSPNGRWVSFLAERPAEPGRGGQIFVAPAGGAPRAQWLGLATDHESPDSHAGRSTVERCTSFRGARRRFSTSGCPIRPEHG